MSQTIVEFTDGDATILIETTEKEGNQGSMAHAGIGDTVKSYIKQKVNSKFVDAMEIISYSSNVVLDEVKKIKDRPEEMKVEFGIKFTGEGDIMVASGKGEVNYKITLSWKKSS